MADVNPSPRRPTFDPTFNLGHVLTMTVIALGVIGAVLTLKDGLTQGLAEMRTKNEVQDQRLESMTREFLRSQSEDGTFRSEVRQSLTQLTGSIADLRVTLATATNSSSAPSTRR